MTKRSTHKKKLSFQDVAEVLIEHIDELKILEGEATQTIELALQKIEAERNRKLEINLTNYLKVANEFLSKFQKHQAIHLQNMREIMSVIVEEQNRINEQTRELNSELWEIQTEVKRLSKVGFGRLPNYLVATLVGGVSVIILILFYK